MSYKVNLLPPVDYEPRVNVEKYLGHWVTTSGQGDYA